MIFFSKYSCCQCLLQGVDTDFTSCELMLMIILECSHPFGIICFDCIQDTHIFQVSFVEYIVAGNQHLIQKSFLIFFCRVTPPKHTISLGFIRSFKHVCITIGQFPHFRICLAIPPHQGTIPFNVTVSIAYFNKSNPHELSRLSKIL